MKSLTETKKALNSAINLFPINSNEVKIPSTVPGQGSKPGRHFSNARDIRTLVTLLEPHHLFTEQVNYLKKSAIFRYDLDAMNIESSESISIQNALNNIYVVGRELLQILENTIPEENPNSINIKLPPNVKDLNELSNATRQLHIAISQVVINDDIGGEEKITRVENGSILINLFIGTSAATGLIASILWSAMVLLKKKKELELFNEQVKAYGLQTANNANLVEMNKKQMDLVMEAEAELILSEHFKINPEDKIERIKNSIKIFSEIIEKGAEIHPSITTPEPISNLFPPMQNLLNIESRVKKITEGN